MTKITAFHKRLHDWYAEHGRKELPWRNTRDAYAIYISETMLQQTQVKTVLERYYHPFLKRFPTLSALAQAEEQEVLEAWQGLGYYSRARSLHKAARMAAPHLPQHAEGLMQLPGIGRNTAHAVAAFAYREPVPVMEANVRRVLARIFALERPTVQELWDKAFLLLNKNDPFDYNQAMMDVGSLVCTRSNPRCDICPAHTICEGKAAPQHYPRKTVKKAPPVRHKHIIVQRNRQGQYYMTPRESRFLGGLYHFTEMDKSPSPSQGEGGGEGSMDAQKTLILTFSLKGRRNNAAMQPLGTIRQQYSHFTLEADVWLIEAEANGEFWHTLQEMERLPVSMAEKKILALLAAHKTAKRL